MRMAREDTAVSDHLGRFNMSSQKLISVKIPYPNDINEDKIITLCHSVWDTV